VARKGEKENFSVKARRGKAKKRFLVLKRGAESRKRDFWCLSVAQKGENRKNHASEHFRKTKMKFFTLLNISERPKRRFSRF